MLETATKTTDNRATTTAEDTLKRKTRDADVISGGHLVAKALKNEGVDTIFTLCGGHIIDIYDGCIDEGIRIMSRSRLTPRTVTRARPASSGAWSPPPDPAAPMP